MYRVNSIYWSIQGEGCHAGSPCVIVRLSGCNLWSGKESDRGSAICQFCDTEFRKFNEMDAVSISEAVSRLPPAEFVLLTGGEPALQCDSRLLECLRATGLPIHMETNGTVALKARPDWVTVSPKAGTHVVSVPDELKVVMPQEGAIDLPECKLKYVQPLDGCENAISTCVKFIRENRGWRLSLQSHKFANLP